VAIARGVGKCEGNHPGSYGYPTRPEEPYDFCSQCGKPMVWECANCAASLPDDADELATARYCRDCGAPYFAEEEASDQELGEKTVSQ
jgi:hypothetical protein